MLFSFRSHYLFAIGLDSVLSLRRSTPASLHSTLKLCDFWNNRGWRLRTGEHIRDDSPLWWNFSDRLSRRALAISKVRALQFHEIRFLHSRIQKQALSTRVTRCYHRYDSCCLFLALMICLSSGRCPALQRWHLERTAFISKLVEKPPAHSETQQFDF